jgi:hypothetical protein
MIIFGIILSVFGIGFLCWLLFTLAVYALPFFAGLSAGLAAFHSGSGVIGALIVGGLAGGATLAIGQIVFATVRTPLIRAAIGLLYAAPAAIAGYHATLGLAHIGMPSEVWRQTFAIVGAVLVGGTAWGRMFLFLRPNGGQGHCSGIGSSASLGGDYAGLGQAPRGRPVGYRRDDGSSGRSATSRPSLKRSRLHSVFKPTETPSVIVAVRAGGGALKPSFLCARVSISSPGMPDHLCAALDVGHVFSRGCCSTPGPHGLSMA